MSNYSSYSLHTIVQQGTKILAKTSPSARLDSEILLAHTLQVDRIFLITRAQQLLEADRIEKFYQLIHRRSKGEPIAYLIGQKDFWSFTLTVTPDVLIPRPETEHLVETVLALDLPQDCQVLELGTGSGAIAIALALERPHWSILATDVSAAALAIAQTNGKRLNTTNICWQENNWFDGLPIQTFSLIVSNPPYLAAHDPHLTKNGLSFEPQSFALIAGEDGLRDLTQIIQQAPSWLKSGGYLFLEHGYQQAESVNQLMENAGFQAIQTIADLAGNPRVTGGFFAPNSG